MTPFAGSGATSTCWWTYKGSTTAANSSTPGTYGFASGQPSQATPNNSNVDLATLGASVAPNIFTGGSTNSLYTLLQPSGSTAYQQDQNYLPALSEAGVVPTKRIFGLGHQLRPPLVQFISCSQVLMEGYQAQCSPFWVHNPVACTDVVIRNVKADSIGPNNDGFDPDACSNVLCDGMTFNTGDDCIAIKSAKNLDTFYGSANNHVIQNCVMNTGHGGITMGSEMGAGVEKVYARNLKMLNLNWATSPLNIAIRIKTNMNRGGSVQNIYIDNISLPNGVNLVGKTDSTGVASSPINTTVALGVATATAGNPSTSQGGVITFDCDYSPNSDAVRTRPPMVNNFQISNVTVGNVTTTGTGSTTPFGSLPTGTVASCFQAIVAQGPVKTDYNGAGSVPTVLPISNVSIKNCNFGTPVCPTTAASSTSPSAIYLWNVSNMTLDQTQIAGVTLNQVLNDVR
jgi:polygalacturonase